MKSISYQQSAISSQPSPISHERDGCRNVSDKLNADRRTLTATAAFTLVEMMVVIVIIAILAAIVIGGAKYAATKAGRSRAQAEIAAMETALESYKNDNGVYPNTYTSRSDVVSNSAVLYTALKSSSGKYFSFKPNQLRVIVTGVTPPYTNIVDPFGGVYNYYCTNDSTLVTNGVTFDLWSFGPDNVNDEGRNDDIINWRQ